MLVSVLGWLFSSPRATAADRSFTPDVFSKIIAPKLQEYCIRCHGKDKQEGGVGLHKFTTERAVRSDRGTWESVSEMVEFGAMPPDEARQPTEAERSFLVGWIDYALNRDLRSRRDPGRVTLRRLNRAEYDNTIRDLTGLDLHLSEEFPSDDVGEGFDNIGDVLSLPPLLFEKYMDAAESVARQAILDVRGRAATIRKEGEQLSGIGSASLTGYGVFGLPSSGMVSGEFSVPSDGEYLLRLEAGARQAGPELAKAELNLDGKRVGVIDVEATPDRMEFYELETALGAGDHRVSATFINDYYKPDAPDPKDRDRNLYIRALEVVGPIDIPPDRLPKSHRLIMISHPDSEKTPRAAAAEILERFVSRAFRRPVSQEELAGIVALAVQAMDNGATFEGGIQVALTATLVSPHFLFRVEMDPDPDNPERQRPLNSYELASRLSYFLWSSMPDEELFELAESGALLSEDVLVQQVHRMIQDQKADALVQNFGDQWLNLRILDDVTPDPEQFGAFDESLREEMREETRLFFGEVMRSDRSVMDFLVGDFTFLNEELAKHYGIDGVQGKDFRLVDLQGQPRRGLLTHGSILTLTSQPTRTSAVKRGKWILENVLGTPPPEPPGNVPPLEATQASAPNLSLREQLELHRKDPVCASCHNLMDDLGFGFENFDAIGRWRTKDGRFPVDASGQLPTGEKFTGAVELVSILGNRQEQFVGMLSRKLMTYGLGRGLQPYDERAIDTIVERSRDSGYRFSSLVAGVVTSEPFRYRRGDGGRG